MQAWVGRTLSKVILLKRLGRGAVTEVYLGHHTTLECPVAVKIMHSFLAEDASQQERFRREAQTVAALRHPNIVQVFDYDLVEGRPYIIMELVEGLALDVYLNTLHARGGRLPPETTARILLGIASALDYAHGRGIVHRDIRPANVLLRQGASPIDPLAPLPLDVEPILSDFGLVRFLNTASQPAPGSATRTAAYLSPEEALGLSADSRSDIYALGVILYEMLAGRLPFDAPGAAANTIQSQHIPQLPPIKHLSPPLQDVLLRTLAKNPQQRWQRAGEFAVALLASIFGPSLPASPAGGLSLAGLQETLALLVDQARRYGLALPANNYPARAAVARLGELAQRALNETKDLAAQNGAAAIAEHPFSPREHEVLGLAACGLTNKEIAYRLGLSERTIQFHMNNIFNKTATASRTEAVAVAFQKKWLDIQS